MDWQLPSAALVVAGAACYLAWSGVRAWRGARAGCGGCACKSKPAPPAETSAPAALIPAEQLTERLRNRCRP